MSLMGFEVEVQRSTNGGGLVTEDMTLSMGPQHPSTHGVLRFVVRADGEVMKEAIPDIGYLHRSIEKIAEKVGWHGFIPYTDRVDYVAAMFCNHGWAMAAEQLGGIEVPKRGEYCRVIADELCRIHSHLLGVGSMAMDIGAFTPFTHAIREREYLNDLFEELCGCPPDVPLHADRRGGLGPAAGLDRQGAALPGPLRADHRGVRSADLLQQDLRRAAGQRRHHLAAGRRRLQSGRPNLRGSGVSYDVRRDDPYSIYPELEFDVPIGRGEIGTLGDCFDRYIVRMREMQQSCRILRQCLAQLPDGPVIARVPRNFKPPAGDCYVRIESARGDMGWYVVSDGTAFPHRCKIRTGSFAAISMIPLVSRDLMIADLVAVIASFDLVAPEIDR